MKIRKQDFLGGLTVLCLISLIIYIVTRAVLLFFTEYSGLEKFLAVLLICAEAFVLLHGAGYALNIFKVLKQPKEVSLSRKILHEPEVAVIVAARDEPKNILEQTFVTLHNLNYKNMVIYFLDDSSDEKFKKEADELAREFNLVLFSRKEWHGAKAGIINDCLKTLTQEYIAIFDADQNPLPDFLNVVIPILEEKKDLAFVQTPQFYTNIEESLIARGAAFQQAVFYEYICEGKNRSDSMFCCGTNVVFRRKALQEVGGLDESTVTEDFSTSIKLHAAGWKSFYFNHVYAFGLGPESLAGYYKQQFRWAAGTITVLRNVIIRLFTKPFSLKLWQWWEYLLSSSYYLVGIAFFILMFCPLVYLLFEIPSFFARAEIYFLVFLPYIILSMSVFYAVLKTRNYKIKDLFLGQLLGVSTFSVYMRAAVSAFLGIKIGFGITEKTKGNAISYFRLWPQLGMVYLSIIAVTWGLNRYIYENEPAVLVNSIWVLYHCIVLSSIFYFNEGARK